MLLLPVKKQKTLACIREIQVHKLWTKVYSQKGLTAMGLCLVCLCLLMSSASGLCLFATHNTPCGSTSGLPLCLLLSSASCLCHSGHTQHTTLSVVYIWSAAWSGQSIRYTSNVWIWNIKPSPSELLNCFWQEHQTKSVWTLDRNIKPSLSELLTETWNQVYLNFWQEHQTKSIWTLKLLLIGTSNQVYLNSQTTLTGTSNQVYLNSWTTLDSIWFFSSSLVMLDLCNLNLRWSYVVIVIQAFWLKSDKQIKSHRFMKCRVQYLPPALKWWP